MVRVQVAVCGPADADRTELAAAREVGRLLAEQGAVVLCGGGGGVMDAAAEGAAASGGLAVGVWSGADRTGTSRHLAVVLTSGLGQARNAVLVQSADAVIAVGGSWGTLSEVAHALRLGVRVVVLHGWGVVGADGRPVGGYQVAATAAQAVHLALASRTAGATAAPSERPDAPVASQPGRDRRD